MAVRVHRTVRSPKIYKLRTTDRDLWILEALAKMRFLTTSQLAVLFFEGSRWSTNKRLRKLLDAGLLNVSVRSLSEENIYSITKRGLNTVEENNITLMYSIKTPRGLDENLNHLLAINDVRTSLALSLPETHGDIVWWRSDWDLRSHGCERIIPDALFLIKWHGLKDIPYALEVDNNTKSAKNFLKKILAYASFQARGLSIYGVSEPIVLVACAHPKWMERYRMSVKHLRLNHRISFAAIKDIKDAGAACAIWVTDGAKKYSLRELTFHPYGKEEIDEKSLNNQTI